MTEVELQLHLDAEGRTIFDVSTKEEHTSKERKKTLVDYSSKTQLTRLADGHRSQIFLEDEQKRTQLMDDLLFDCEITDFALLPRTFWMPANGMQPRCALEQCALEIFQKHVKDGVEFDPITSGAEWWVQIRPSPPAGRYNLLPDKQSKDSSNSNDNEDTKKDEDMETSGICFHWDKDEDLRIMMGGNMYIHPHISTVTYFSDIGAPTMALNYRVNIFTGEYESPSETEAVEAYFSWPKRGKHLSFDGKFLHAAPSNLLKAGEWKKQISAPADVDAKDMDEKDRKKQLRRRRRTTFLVNIWLNYKPVNTNIFPSTMTDKLSKVIDEEILFDNQVGNCSANSMTYNGSNHSSDEKNGNVSFEWPMGGCDSKESICMDLPLEKIQNQMDDGGNIHMSWESKPGEDRAIRLKKDENESSR
eukprot:CAMPEP_0194119938 /NCGR_PEP_ID=MMETSP0150-20130528/41352_1 /TAXON_ID=122233 /ORGANISM="Chaetoceros debilis, Strain MM31A-1" /LENGTH=416 /DNA_ID=CAMNT_0038811817 /DNA_START=18 /DNA_END=1264 /DNA_ORIENTATION=-